MIKSMTAYGRASKNSRGTDLVVEVHSVNKRGLDINIYAPRELLYLDMDLRKWVGEKVGRGQVSVRISMKQDVAARAASPLYYETLKHLKEKWEQLASQLGFSKKDIDLQFLANQMQMADGDELVKDEKGLKEAIKELLEKALQEFTKMKMAEGKHLAKEIQHRLQLMKEMVKKIKEKSLNAPAKYREKLKEKIAEALEGVSLDEERLLREVALFAEKVDTAEEISRLDSHLQQGSALLDDQEKPAGKTIEFLVQEMLREVNTIGSKASDIEIANLTIHMKSEIEKIREQVQNVE